ncbi:unnamed protein product [Clonostachys rosea]|uniref:Protein kinase domain-containing protein n=1 Tax=Bionectria ochroleuca TaxID=29856 RepID=A0ABY6TRP3_BIOOC|nr:unnamed protein product [Clonostachys rosea]
MDGKSLDSVQDSMEMDGKSLDSVEENMEIDDKPLDSVQDKAQNPFINFVEDENECPGGHYNVAPDEIFHGDQRNYQVMLNLHFGDRSTVWVCYDDKETKYWALKILSVAASKNPPEDLAEDLREPLANRELKKVICLSVDKFEVQGPKGVHICFVYPLLGPKAHPGPLSAAFEMSRQIERWGDIVPIRCLKEDSGFFDMELISDNSDYCSKMPPKFVNKSGKAYSDLANAVRFIHRHNLCHGRIIPDNVLYRIRGLDCKKSVDEVTSILTGKEDKCIPEQIHTLFLFKEVKRIHKGAGYWKSKSVFWNSVHPRYLTCLISLIDFGQCFRTSEPPSTLQLPKSYQPPELIHKSAVGPYTDIWTLGCTLYELRMGGSCPDLINTSKPTESDPVWTLKKSFEVHGIIFTYPPAPLPYAFRLMQNGDEQTAFQSLLKRLLKYDYEKRGKAKAIANDFWFHYMKPKVLSF